MTIILLYDSIQKYKSYLLAVIRNSNGQKISIIAVDPREQQRVQIVL